MILLQSLAVRTENLQVSKIYHHRVSFCQEQEIADRPTSNTYTGGTELLPDDGKNISYVLSVGFLRECGDRRACDYQPIFHSESFNANEKIPAYGFRSTSLIAHHAPVGLL